jgi:hypothetical protein
MLADLAVPTGFLSRTVFVSDVSSGISAESCALATIVPFAAARVNATKNGTGFLIPISIVPSDIDSEQLLRI